MGFKTSGQLYEYINAKTCDESYRKEYGELALNRVEFECFVFLVQHAIVVFHFRAITIAQKSVESRFSKLISYRTKNQLFQ